MVGTHGAIAAAAPDRSTCPLCFLVEEDVIFRQNFARQLRQHDIDTVEFSNTSRFMGMVDERSPDIVFVNLNSTAPHECVRALSALKECKYSGAVQLFGSCNPKLLESLNIIGADCSLRMLPPLTKPIEFTTIHKIVLEQKLFAPVALSDEISLDDALAKNLLSFLYQPKLDLKTRTMLGVELVARVTHPERGLLTPDRFLKGANDDALLKLSRAALVDAIKASAHFLALGVNLRPAINISADNLLRLPVTELVQACRPEHKDWPGLILEIPERQMHHKIDLLKVHAPRLRQSGVSLALDNCGLAALRLDIMNQIAVAEIKIDLTLIEGCASNPGAAKICKSVIQIAHNFGAEAVAIGISTEADLRKLLDLGCDTGQGFLLGKPVTMQQMDALIAAFRGKAV
jgi:EAL domain-containing protein (putative c-di-GMP-specific phosphodiesterase class I)